MARAVPEDKLLKIGMEGFDMLDACPRTNGRRGGLVVTKQEAGWQNHQNPQTRVYRMTTQAASKAGVMIDSNEAAKMYGGVVIAEYPMKGFFRRLFG